ncbi:Uncharacterised protein [Faecalicoccus pleomorphus]|uniref:Uncharacterized protein n=1 Tax=Faecalicoccus pleomorphus TaxID=1323 RepID=A0A380LNK1_9FIRM|nr:hypothetical protein [Faecalicoccus pleomorphus]SUO03436.1 Uncharacterised protein [Faecalicoccus pleomorphus]
MYGETVVYGTIGGQNLSNSMMRASINGSTIEGEELEDVVAPTYVIAWNFPGGITGHSFSEYGSWGFLLNVGEPCDDVQLAERLNALGLISYEGTDLSTIEFPEGEEAAKNEINRLLNQYLLRMMNYTTNNPSGPYNIYAFQNAFSGCVTVVSGQ